MKFHQFLGLFCCLQQLAVHRKAAVSSFSNDFLAGMVEIHLTMTLWGVKMAEPEFWEKGKTLTRTVFYGYAALREIITGKLISAEGVVSLNWCAYISGFMVLILQSVVPLGISAF